MLPPISSLDVLVIGSVAYRVERTPPPPPALNIHLCTNTTITTTRMLCRMVVASMLAGRTRYVPFSLPLSSLI